MTDDTDRSEDASPAQDTNTSASATTTATRPRRGIAGEQLRAAAKVMESEVSKAQARARALSADAARFEA